jgi:hypothetical protein
MPVDVSMYPQPQPPQNPLAMMSQVAGLQGQLQQNQLRAKTMAATQAQGEADAAATSADGTYDPKASLAALAQNSNGTYAMHQAGIDAQAMQQAQLAQHVQQVELGIKQQGFMTQQLGSLADTPNVNGKQVADLAAGFVKNGLLDAKTAATELAAMPMDETRLPQYLQGLQKRSMDAEQQLQLYHQNLLVNTGPTTATMNVAPLANQAPVTMGMSPSDANTPVAGPQNSDGSPTTILKGDRAQIHTPVTVGVGPSATAAGSVSGASNANQGVDLQKTADTMPDVKSMLGNMAGDLKDFTSGPGSHSWKNFRAGAIRMGVPVDENTVASQENFTKLATQMAQRQFSILGHGSDQTLQSAMNANPNEAISKLGNQRIIEMLKGNADAITFKNKLWQSWLAANHGSDTYGQFSNSFNKHFDPRAFQFQYMSPDEQGKAISGMSPAEVSKFRDDYNFAVAAGGIPHPKGAK